MDLHNLSCCGIKEITSLASWNEAEFYHLVRAHGAKFRAAYLIFNGPAHVGYVKTFRDYILKHNLGTVTDLPQLVNPNSSNVLDVGIWGISRDALALWLSAKAAEFNNVCPCASCISFRRQNLAYAARVTQETEALRARNQAQQIVNIPLNTLPLTPPTSGFTDNLTIQVSR